MIGLPFAHDSPVHSTFQPDSRTRTLGCHKRHKYYSNPTFLRQTDTDRVVVVVTGLSTYDIEMPKRNKMFTFVTVAVAQVIFWTI